MTEQIKTAAELIAEAEAAMAQAEQLKIEAAAAKDAEKEAAIEVIGRLIAEHSLHAGHIRVPAHPAAKTKSQAKRVKAQTASVAKFKSPDGKTWTGRGRSPVWYKGATVEQRAAMAVA